jgi:ribonuclease-3
MHKHDDLEELQALLGVTFHDVRLLDQARTDKSVVAWCPECVQDGQQGNKLLEFLGDTALNFILAHEVVRQTGTQDAGFARLLLDGQGGNQLGLKTNKFLARVALRMGLGPFIHAATDKGPFYGSGKIDVLANAMEAIVEAIRIDQGGEVATAFIRREILRFLEKDQFGDYVVRHPLLPTEELAELLEAEGGEPPAYNSYDGPSQLPNGMIEVWVWSGNRRLASGLGVTLEEASEEAARQALLEDFEWTDEETNAD